ncbi:MAG: hypothetical protein ACK5HU_01715 [Flavobacteriales bacterium]
MKKISLTTFVFLFGILIFAQVGINTNDPSARLHVINPTPENTMDITMLGTNNCGSICNKQTPRHLVLYNQNKTNSAFATLAFVPSSSGTGSTGASITGIDRNATKGYAGLSFGTRHDDGFHERMRIASTGNIGIGTNNPTANLQVNGNLRYVDGNQSNNRILVSDANGNASWIDFNTLLDMFTGSYQRKEILLNNFYMILPVSSVASDPATHFTISSNKDSEGDCLYLEAIVITGSNPRVSVLQNNNFCSGSPENFPIIGNNTNEFTIKNDTSSIVITARTNDIKVTSSGDWIVNIERKVLR